MSDRETPFAGEFQDQIDAIIAAVRGQDGVAGIRAFQRFADAVATADRAGVTLRSEPLDEGLLARVERLPRVRLTGAQLNDINPDPEAHVWVDWDEYDEFVSLTDVRALAAEEPTARLAGTEPAPTFDPDIWEPK